MYTGYRSGSQTNNNSTRKKIAHGWKSSIRLSKPRTGDAISFLVRILISHFRCPSWSHNVWMKGSLLGPLLLLEIVPLHLVTQCQGGCFYELHWEDQQKVKKMAELVVWRAKARTELMVKLRRHWGDFAAEHVEYNSTYRSCTEKIKKRSDTSAQENDQLLIPPKLLYEEAAGSSWISGPSTVTASFWASTSSSQGEDTLKKQIPVARVKEREKVMRWMEWMKWPRRKSKKEKDKNIKLEKPSWPWMTWHETSRMSYRCVSPITWKSCSSSISSEYPQVCNLGHHSWCLGLPALWRVLESALL